MTKFLTLFLLFSIVAFGQTSTKIESDNKQNQSTKDWEKLNHSNYSIQYPATWELNQSGQMGTRFILFSPLESNKDNFKENVNLLIQDLSGRNIDLNKYTEISEYQIKTIVPNSNLIESKRMKNQSSEYQKIIYSGDQGMYHLKFEQYYWVINEKAFILTLTCEQDKFATTKEIGENILNSFIIK